MFIDVLARLKERKLNMIQECNNYELLPLVRRQDYIEDCINLLNQVNPYLHLNKDSGSKKNIFKEWSRSYAARENSLKRALNEVPDLSLILITKSDQKLIGHARICILPMNSIGCWVESVIIHDSLRGKGIGKVLMYLVEQKAREFGYSEVSYVFL